MRKSDRIKSDTFCLSVTFFSRSESSCITIESINRAFAEASAKLRQGSGAPKNARGGQNLEAEVDLLGRIIVETTRLLAEE